MTMLSRTHEGEIAEVSVKSAKRTKVLHFTACPDGGPKRQILDIVRNVPSDEIESQGAFIDPARCAVLDADPEDSYAEHFRRLGLHCYLLDFPRHLDPWKDLKTLFTLIGILRRERPDVLHCHSSKAGVVGRIAAFFCPTCTVYYSPHGIWFFWQKGLKRIVYYLVEWLFAPACNGMIAVSPSEERTLRQFFASRRIIRINNGVDLRQMAQVKGDRFTILRELGIPDTSRLALTVTRLETVKNVPTLIEGFSRLTSSPDRPVHLLIAGEGQLKSSLEELATSLGVRDRVHFLGWRNDIPQLIVASDCVVLTSHAEGLPYSLLEAGALCRPVIATRVNGSADVVLDKESGFLFEPGDIDALAALLNQVLFNPHLQNKMGEAGREFISEHFTVEGMWKSYADLYKYGQVKSVEVKTAAAAASR